MADLTADRRAEIYTWVRRAITKDSGVDELEEAPSHEQTTAKKTCLLADLLADFSATSTTTTTDEGSDEMAKYIAEKSCLMMDDPLQW